MLVTVLASDHRRQIGVFVTGIAGLAFTIWSVVAAIKGAGTHKWLTGHGMITVSRVEPDWRDRLGYQFYRVVISYTFSVAGSSRVGHQVSVGDGGAASRLKTRNVALSATPQARLLRFTMIRSTRRTACLNAA
jgi:hypothetical protein